MLSSKKGYELVKLMPIEKILIETDGPLGVLKHKLYYPGMPILALQY